MMYCYIDSTMELPPQDIVKREPLNRCRQTWSIAWVHIGLSKWESLRGMRARPLIN
jgi:hypothetical protein